MENRRGLLIVIISIIMIFINSCEYYIDKTYYRDVNRNIPLTDSEIILNLNADTIYSYGGSAIKLSLRLKDKELYSVKFFVNGKEVEEVYEINDYCYFHVQKEEMPAKVRLEINIKSGNGSIADILSEDILSYQTKVWTIIYVPENPFVKTEIIDGRLKISWTPIKSDKAKYKIYRFYNYNGYLDTTFNNWFIDSLYIGGNARCLVWIDDDGASNYSSELYFSYPTPKLYLNNKDSFLISWDKSKFYNSMEGYRLRIGNEKYILKSTDSFYVYKEGLLGKETEIQADLLKNGYEKDESKYYSFGYVSGFYPSAFVGYYDEYPDSYFPLVGTNFYLFESYYKLGKYSLENNTGLAKIDLSINKLNISPNNKFILSFDRLKLDLIDTENLNILKSKRTSDLLNYTIFDGKDVSDDGSVVLYDSTINCMTIYNLLNESKTNIPVAKDVNDYKISANGKYVFEPKLNALYLIENLSYTTVWSDEYKSDQYSFFEFYPDRDKIALYDGSNFYINNCSDFSNDYSFQLSNTTVLNIDFNYNKILTYYNNAFYVYSLIDGTLLNKINTYSRYGYLFNNYIFCNGSQIYLN